MKEISPRILFSMTLMTMLAACGNGAWDAADGSGNPARPVDTTPQVIPVADPSQPVASGNTPAAADAAALAALNAQFDPARDPAKDLQTAIVEAKRGGRRIILNIGGEWCPWCHIMDSFIDENSDIRRFRDANYVWVKVNYSDENKNTDFLSQYPEIEGYPHLFVLDADGQLLHSQFTGDLEKGKSYDYDKFFMFLKEWAPLREDTET